MAETVQEEIKRLQAEIAVRQSRLHRLILGDQAKTVYISCHANTGYSYNDHMR